MKRFEIERRALKEHYLAMAEVRTEREIVAVGFKFPWANSMVFEELRNISVEDHRFEVSAGDLAIMLDSVVDRYGLDKANEVESVWLWHSHPAGDEASKVDIENLPEWADGGFVYHTPTRATSRYNHFGVILEANGHSPHATNKELDNGWQRRS